MKYHYDKYSTKLSGWSAEHQENDYVYFNDNTIKLWNTSPAWSGTRYFFYEPSDWSYQSSGWQIHSSGDEPTDMKAVKAHYDGMGYNNTANRYEYYRKRWIRTRSYIKNTFIETIQAEENSLPSNGYKDGFWYIKKEPVMSGIYIVMPDHKLKRLPLFTVIEENKLKRRYVYQVMQDHKLKKL